MLVPSSLNYWESKVIANNAFTFHSSILCGHLGWQKNGELQVGLPEYYKFQPTLKNHLKHFTLIIFTGIFWDLIGQQKKKSKEHIFFIFCIIMADLALKRAFVCQPAFFHTTPMWHDMHDRLKIVRKQESYLCTFKAARYEKVERISVDLHARQLQR